MRRPFVSVSAGLVISTSLLATIIGGCPGGGSSDNSRFNRPPRVVLNVNPDPPRGIAPLTVEFRSDDSTDDGAIVSRLWNFGNGQTSNNATQEVRYDQNGQYTVTLTLTDDIGATSTAQTVVIVAEQPVAQFTVGYVPTDDSDVVPNQTTATLSPATFEFDASSSFDPDGDPNKLSYSFNFGDGATVDVPKIRHTFSSAGAFRVVLTVIDETGIKDTAEVFITVGIRQPVIQFRSPPAEISELIASPTSPLWTYVAFDVEPEVPYTIRAGLDVDRDPNPNATDILLDTDATDGVQVLDLPLTIPTALDLSSLTPDVSVSYNLFAELRTDRTPPVRAYANAKITIVPAFPADTTTAPRVPFTVDSDGSERARVVMPRVTPSQSRFVFDVGRLNRGDRLAVALLTTPGYTESYDANGARFALLDATERLFGVWESDPEIPILYNATSSYPMGDSSLRNFFVVDAAGVDAPVNLQEASRVPAPSLSIRVVRNALPPNFVSPVQRIYLNFEGRASAVVAPRQEAFLVAKFDLPDPRDDNLIKQQIEDTFRAALDPLYRVEITSSFVFADPARVIPPPTPPYTEILFDTGRGLSPGVFVDADELLLFGRPEISDPRNSTLSGVGVVAVNRIDGEFPGLSDADIARAAANAALHQFGLLCGLHRTQSPANDIMTNNNLSVTSPLTYSNVGIIEVPPGVTPIGTQNAGKILGELLGLD